MDKFCQEIFGNLNIYERNYTLYTKCLCRGIEIIISNKPEEKVRQIFLYFLINQSGLFPDLVNLKAEYNNLDIAIYKNSELEDFRPFQPPAAIIEVKREEEKLLDHAKQLYGYLDEHRSLIGILFNGSDLILFRKSDEESIFLRSHLDSIKDFPAILRESLSKVNIDCLEFQKAKNGNVDSFVHLIKKYGKYTQHKFSFLLTNSCEVIHGSCFSYDQDYVYYDLYGKYSPSRRNRFSFKYHSFDRLISLVYPTSCR
jgi:Type I restriction enzyme R protein N terminus (HSDR_N)